MATTAQLLFRVFHGTSNKIQFQGSSATTAVQSIEPTRTQIDYNDYLYSVPTGTIDLTEMVNTLVQAEATLCVGTGIYWVAVFQLSPDKPADHMTPISVFHPFGDWRLLPHELLSEDDITAAVADPTGSAQKWQMVIDYNLFGMPFWSYDLWGKQTSDPTFATLPDRFHVLNVRQETPIGRNRLHFHKLCVTTEDFFWSFRDTLTMRVDSPLFRLRFPLWRQIIKRIPWQHIGYRVLDNGQLEPREVALTWRACGGVSTMSKQRKILARRNRSHNLVLYNWHRLCRKIMRWLIVNEHTGYSKAVSHYNHYGTMWHVVVSTVDYYPLQQLMNEVCDWVNMVGLATGNNSLIATSPGMSELDRYSKFVELSEYLQGTKPSLLQFSQHPDTENARVLQQIIRHVNYTYRVIRDFKREVAVWRANVEEPSSETYEVWRGEGKALFNRFGEKWPDLQRQAHYILQLLQTWHLTFLPRETTAGTPGNKGLVHRNYQDLRQDEYVGKSETKVAITAAPSMSGRVAQDLPQFLPFRFWNFVPVEPNIEIEDYTTSEINRLEAWQIEQERLRLEAEIKRLQLKIQSEARTATILSEWEQATITWNDYTTTDRFALLQHNWEGLYADMAPELRQFAEGAIDRINQAFDEIADLRAKINALGEPGITTATTYREVQAPPAISVADEPYPELYRWIYTEWEDQRGDFLEWRGDGFIEQTGFPMSGHVLEYSDRQLWPTVDPDFDWWEA